MTIMAGVTSLLPLKPMNIRNYSMNLRRSIWSTSYVGAIFAIGWCAVVSCTTAKGQVASTISTNWVKTPANDTMWMSAVFNTSGTVTNGETFYITHASVAIPSSGPTQTVNLPNATITYSSSYATATTSYNAVTSTWVTDVPLSDAGKSVFMTGGEYTAPATGITKNLSNVAMTADFAASTSAEVMWQWSATAYNTFSTNLNALGVQVLNGSNTVAGTPDHFANMSYVDQGGTGISGCAVMANPTCQVCLNVPPVVVPEPSSALLFSAAAMFFFRRARRLR